MCVMLYQSKDETFVDDQLNKMEYFLMPEHKTTKTEMIKNH